MSGNRYETLGLGLGGELDWLCERAKSLRPGSGGTTVFVGGDEGSGRTALLDAVTGELSRQRAGARVIAGTFESGRYVPVHGDRRRLARAARLVEGIVAATGPVDPVAGLAAQIVSQSKGALSAATALAGESKRAHSMVLLPQLLRRAAESEGPLVCLIDDTDESDEGWWTDLMLTFSRQIAVDLPLLLVFALRGPTQLGEAQEDEQASLFVARSLVAEGLAHWRPLPRVDRETLASWIGTGDPAIAEAIREISGGRASWASEIWREWRESDLVVRDHGAWRFADEDMVTALSPVNHIFGRRLREVVGEDDLEVLAAAQQILACGALEGRTFTADATALVLQREADEVIDLLDDWLVGDGNEPGLVEEVPTVTVDDEAGTRHLRRYRFRAELDWLVLRHYGSGDERLQRGRALAIADALRSLYGAQPLAARTLAALYAMAGERKRARSFQRIWEIGVDHETRLLRARAALALSPAAGRPERNRAAELLLAGASALYNYGPWQEGVLMSERAVSLTDRPRVKATGLYYAAWFHYMLDDYDTARVQLEGALAGRKETGDRHGTADALHQLANLDRAEERYESAERGYREVLELRNALRDLSGVATAHEALGDIFYERDEPTRARTQYERAIELSKQEHDALAVANVRCRLARLDLEASQHDRARAALHEVLEVQREHLDRRTTYAALRVLAEVEYDLERYEQALEHTRAALAVADAIGEPNVEPWLQRLGHIHLALGRVAFEGEDWSEARNHLEASLQVELEVNDGNLAPELRHRIGTCLVNEGRHRDARRVISDAIEHDRESGDSSGISIGEFNLAVIDAREGATENAIARLRNALAIERELGDAEGEATTLDLLLQLES